MPLAHFGESVLYMELKDNKDDRPKIERNLMSGIWLGTKGRTEEHIIGTPEGVVKAFTVKRRPVEERWSLEEAHAMKGTPGKPNPGTNDQRMPVRIRVPETPIKRSEEAGQCQEG